MARTYALVERERRFLVGELPADEPVTVRRLTDRYVHGTRLRLRYSEVVAGEPAGEVVRKLTQKLADPGAAGGRQGLITTIYLDAAEHRELVALPADELTKVRLSIPPMGVDVFEGPLAGLLIAEVEFADDDAMAGFRPPSWCGPEVTDDDRYRGSVLAACAAGRGEPPPWPPTG